VTTQAKGIYEEIALKPEAVKLLSKAIKEVTLFNVDVYEVRIYAPRIPEKAKNLIKDVRPLLIRLKFLRDISSEELAPSWTSDIEKTCKKNCENILKQVKKISKKLPDVKEGNFFHYYLGKNNAEIFLGKKSLGKLTANYSTNAVLQALIGKDAPDNLRKNLLNFQDE
jgi:hypothetical protein